MSDHILLRHDGIIRKRESEAESVFVSHSAFFTVLRFVSREPVGHVERIAATVPDLKLYRLRSTAAHDYRIRLVVRDTAVIFFFSLYPHW
jgi:hypothetical protein